MLAVVVSASGVAPPGAPVALDVGASSDEPELLLLPLPSVSAVAVVVAARATLRFSSSWRADDSASPRAEHTAAATKASKVKATRATPVWFISVVGVVDVRLLASVYLFNAPAIG